MSNYNVIDLEKPEQIIEDHLSELLRVKARKILSEALELEMELFMKEYQSYRLSDGRQRVVRHGYNRLLVIVGATENGDKELVALEDGYREREQSWRELLMDLKHRGLTEAPKIAVGGGAMGFWKALKIVYPLNPPSLLSN